MELQQTVPAAVQTQLLNLRGTLEEHRHQQMMKKPSASIERMIGYLGRHPNFATGDAIKILQEAWYHALKSQRATIRAARLQNAPAATGHEERISDVVQKLKRQGIGTPTVKHQPQA